MLSTNLTEEGGGVDVARRVSFNDVHLEFLGGEEFSLTRINVADMISYVVVGSLYMSVQLVLKVKLDDFKPAISTSKVLPSG